MKLKITKRTVDRLRDDIVNFGKTIYAYDTELSGFGVWVTATGVTTFFIEYRMPNRSTGSTRSAIGRYGRITPEQARQRAKQLLAQVTSGTDVARVKATERRATSVRELVSTYLDARQADLRPASHKEASRYLQKAWASLHKLAVNRVSRHDIVRSLDRIEAERGKVAADRARAHLSSFFGWLIDRSYCDTNPAQNIRPRSANGPRERFLNEAELGAIWRACDTADDYCRIIKLLMLTGQRKTEISDLQWKEFDADRCQLFLPPQRTKNGREHIVPLSSQAMKILEVGVRVVNRDFIFGEGKRGFQGWSRAKAALDARLSKEIEPWTVHDLRRSVSTHLSENGFAHPHIVEAILNHVSGYKAGVAGVYNKASYLAEKREAIKLWGDRLEAVALKEPA